MTLGTAVTTPAPVAASAPVKAPRKPRASKLPAGLPRILPLELVEWERRISCAYLCDHRIVGGKPWGGGRGIYTFDIRSEQLLRVLQRVKARGAEHLGLEVYSHPDGEYACYIDNELMQGKRVDSLNSRPRRVGSTLVLHKRELPLKDILNSHPKLVIPTPAA